MSTSDEAPDWLAEPDDEKPDFLAEVEEGDELSSPQRDGHSSPSEPRELTRTSEYAGRFKSKGRYGNKRGYGGAKSSESVSYRDSKESDLSEKQKERLRKRAMNICMYQLGQRVMPSMKLRERMIKKELPDFIIDETIAKLEEMELVDDEEYGRNFIQNRREYQRRGDRRIAMELQRKGFTREQVEELIEEEPELDVPTEEERAYDLARSKVRSSRGVDRQKRLSRLVGALGRSGFTDGVFDIARTVLEEDEAAEEEENS